MTVGFQRRVIRDSNAKPSVQNSGIEVPVFFLRQTSTYTMGSTYISENIVGARFGTRAVARGSSLSGQ